MPVSRRASRCRSAAGWGSANPASSAWWKAMFGTCEPARNTNREHACRPAFRPRRAIAYSTFRCYSLVTYGFVGYDSVGTARLRKGQAMAITDLDVFAHLTDANIENLGVELDAIRQDIEDSRGERDARYIRRTIAAQRALEVAGRVLLAASSRRSAWWAGTLTLGVAKIIENMEIGHNVMHGQWDWMNDPEIHSSSWEWDMMGSSKHWRYTHNYVHHKYTNILGMDDDVGYGLLRVTRDHPWQRFNLFNVFYNTMLALGFEWGVGLQHVEVGKIVKKRMDNDEARERVDEFLVKAGAQVFKDYMAFPGLTAVSPWASFKSTLKANIVANIIRNVWANAIIFCGHFPDGAEKFTKTDMVGETKGHWYLRQMLGSANFEPGPVLRFMNGNMCLQI